MVELPVYPGTLIIAHLVGDYLLQNDVLAKNKASSHLACAVHVALYTAAFYALTVGVWPWWAYLVIAATHYPVDRWGLARIWMTRVSGQKSFAEAMGPWSVIIVDNAYHLVCAWLVWVAVAAT
jgi:hypothetical protein